MNARGLREQIGSFLNAQQFVNLVQESRCSYLFYQGLHLGQIIVPVEELGGALADPSEGLANLLENVGARSIELHHQTGQ